MGSERREITAGVGYRVGVRPGIGFRREEGQVQIQLGYQTDLQVLRECLLEWGWDNRM